MRVVRLLPLERLRLPIHPHLSERVVQEIRFTTIPRSRNDTVARDAKQTGNHRSGRQAMGRPLNRGQTGIVRSAPEVRGPNNPGRQVLQARLVDSEEKLRAILPVKGVR